MVGEQLEQYFPVDVTDYPDSHMATEGIEMEKETYFRSLIETAADDVAQDIASQLEGLYARNHDVIILREQDESIMQDVHEHEYLHRLHEYEIDRPFASNRLNTLYQTIVPGAEQPEPTDPAQFIKETWYRPDDWWVRTDEDLAEAYDEALETTKAIVMPDDVFENEHRVYYRALTDQAIEFVGEGDWYNGLERGEIRADFDTPIEHHSELLTHYLVHVFDNDQTMLIERDVVDDLEEAEQAMERLDKATGYDKQQLIRTFTDFDDAEAVIEAGMRESPIEPDERSQLNGYLIAGE